MTLSLQNLKPQIINIRIVGAGLPVDEIPVLPLSYIQWQNATLGIKLPEAQNRKILVDVNKPPVEALDYSSLEYQAKVTEYNNEVALRRIAIALAGGGFAELQGLTLDEQVELIRDMDSGLLNAIYKVLDGMATKRIGSPFRRSESEASANGDADLSPSALVAGTVPQS